MKMYEKLTYNKNRKQFERIKMLVPETAWECNTMPGGCIKCHYCINGWPTECKHSQFLHSLLRK